MNTQAQTCTWPRCNRSDCARMERVLAAGFSCPEGASNCPPLAQANRTGPQIGANPFIKDIAAVDAIAPLPAGRIVISDFAKMVGLSRRAVRRFLVDLHQEGLIHWEHADDLTEHESGQVSLSPLAIFRLAQMGSSVGGEA